MVGQDDIDPSQETNEEVAEDPRSYTAKSVPQRMAIISAGVIMNLITGSLFYVLAMYIGLDVVSSRVGYVVAGQPAWKAGMRPDDLITAINGRSISEFRDITRGTALSSGSIVIEGEHSDGETFSFTLDPDSTGSKRVIGVTPDYKPALPERYGSEEPLMAIPGSQASQLKTLQPGAAITYVNGTRITHFAELRAQLAAHRAEPLELVLQPLPTGDSAQASESSPDTVQVTIAPQPFRAIGARMDIGKVTAIQAGSVAEQQGMKEGDRIIKVDGLDITREIDPLTLPDYFATRAGSSVSVVVKRAVEQGAVDEVTLDITPVARPGWVEVPFGPAVPLSIPALGIAFEIVSTIVVVEPGSPAEVAGLKESDVVTSVTFIPDADFPADLLEHVGTMTFDLTANTGAWAFVFWKMQEFPTWDLELAVKSTGDAEPRKIRLTPKDVPDWFVPSARGLQFSGDSGRLQAKSPGEAFSMGWNETTGSATDIYLTLRSLFTGNISPTELQGPIGIVGIGMSIARSGFAPFLVFLGFLSVNLAVINFLPIPVLDGGHMTFLIYEGVTRRKPSEKIYAIATYIGLAFVLGLMIFVITLDVMRKFE